MEIHGNPLRQSAFEAFQVGVRAADPTQTLQSAIVKTPPVFSEHGQCIFIAAGKAACKMADVVLRHIPKAKIKTAVAVTNYENHIDIAGCQVFGAGHPVPDANGLKAAQTIISALSEAQNGDHVLVCLSGGASALLPAPVSGLTLADKAQANEVMLKGGFDITEINLVRQALSKLKGGGMLKYAHPATVQSYILSDVLGDDLRVIGSGPSVGRIGATAEARELLQTTGIFAQMPKAVQQVLEKNRFEQEDILPKPNAVLIGSNAQSLAAMAAHVKAKIYSKPLTGDVQTAADVIINKVLKHDRKAPFALAFGGETTVTLTGTGQGGRNQELALRVAVAAETAGIRGRWCFLSGGTDGRDGPTDAAGGLVDPGTVDRIAEKGGNIQNFLANNDSYAALLMSGDLLITGPTGTNVADLQLFLWQP